MSKKMNILSVIFTMSFFLFQSNCVNNNETESKNASRNLENNTKSFVYNMVPDNPNASISPQYSIATNTFSVKLLNKIYKCESCNRKNLVLKQLGINGIFTPGGLSQMLLLADGEEDGELRVTQVRHVAGIETDEEGTNAYVTTCVAGTENAEPNSPDIILDRPFVYFIRAGSNGLILLQVW